MNRFSERFGFQKPAMDLREDEMPDSLKNGLWDAICNHCLVPCDRWWGNRHEGYTPHFESYSRMFWFDILKSPIDTRPTIGADAYNTIRATFFKSKYFQLYDILEHSGKFARSGSRFYEFCNIVFERERAAFRFGGDLLIRISDEQELEEVGSSISTSPAMAVRNHIRRAAELYSDRSSPDYRNSIKESISAVEAAVSFLSGDKNTGISRSLQRTLDEKLLHPALRQGFEKLYAYTSDEGGIRHALLDDGREIQQEDARYMLISCSAFSNYLLALGSRR